VGAEEKIWLSSPSYHEKFNLQMSHHYFPKKIYGKCIFSEPKYKADFSPYLSGPFYFYSYHGMSKDSFKNRNEELLQKGFNLTWRQKFDCNNRTYHQGTWVKL